MHMYALRCSYVSCVCTHPAQAKTKELKNTLNNEFRLIHDL